MEISVQMLESEVAGLRRMMQAAIDDDCSYAMARIMVVNQMYCTFGKAAHVLELARRVTGLSLEGQEPMTDDEFNRATMREIGRL